VKNSIGKLFTQFFDRLHALLPAQIFKYSPVAAAALVTLAGPVVPVAGQVQFQALYSFTGGGDGSNPNAGLVQASDGNLYGTTYNGGTIGVGTVFRITTNGAYTSLYSFSGNVYGGTDGGNPYYGSLVQASDGNLYGTTEEGGTNGDGTVFQITTNGAEAVLYSFTGGNDGRYAFGGLVQASDGNLYGTTGNGGTNGYGTVFRMTINGALTSLYSFTGGNDGGNPLAGLVQASDGNLYGTTFYGGNTNLNGYGYGTVFRITTNGVETVLYSFTGEGDGGNPVAGLVQASDGKLYGTTEYGGTNGYGTIFALLVPIPLYIQLNGQTVVLTWNDPASVFFLQAAPTMDDVFTNIPGATSPYTNPITGSQQFFRLTSTAPPVVINPIGGGPGGPGGHPSALPVPLR